MFNLTRNFRNTNVNKTRPSTSKTSNKQKIPKTGESMGKQEST